MEEPVALEPVPAGAPLPYGAVVVPLADGYGAPADGFGIATGVVSAAGAVVSGTTGALELGGCQQHVLGNKVLGASTKWSRLTRQQS